MNNKKHLDNPSKTDKAIYVPTRQDDCQKVMLESSDKVALSKKDDKIRLAGSFPDTNKTLPQQSNFGVADIVNSLQQQVNNSMQEVLSSLQQQISDHELTSNDSELYSDNQNQSDVASSAKPLIDAVSNFLNGISGGMGGHPVIKESNKGNDSNTITITVDMDALQSLFKNFINSKEEYNN